MVANTEQQFRFRGPIQESTWKNPLCRNYDTRNTSFSWQQSRMAGTWCVEAGQTGAAETAVVRIVKIFCFCPDR